MSDYSSDGYSDDGFSDSAEVEVMPPPKAGEGANFRKTPKASERKLPPREAVRPAKDAVRVKQPSRDSDDGAATSEGKAAGGKSAENGSKQQDSKSESEDAWRDDPGVVIEAEPQPDTPRTVKKRHEQEILDSTSRGWGAKATAHHAPDLLAEFTVKHNVKHILKRAVTPASSSRRGASRSGKRRGVKASKSVPQLPSAQSSRRRGKAKNPPHSPVDTGNGDETQHNQHYHDMAAMKTVIDREGQLRFCRRLVQVMHKELDVDDTTNTDTLVKELMDGLMLLRSYTVACVEAVHEWRRFATEQRQPRRARGGEGEVPETAAGEQQQQQQAKLVPFIWNGQDYLKKLRNDLDFLADVPPLLSALGIPPERLRGNPFMGPKTLSELADEAEAGEGEAGEAGAAKEEGGKQSSKQQAKARREAAQALLVQEELAARQDSGSSPRQQAAAEDSVHHPLFTKESKSKGKGRKRKGAPASRTLTSLERSLDQILERQQLRTTLQSPPRHPAPGVLGTPDGRLIADPDSNITQQLGGAKLVPLPLPIVNHTYYTHGSHPHSASVASLDSTWSEVSTWSLPMVSYEGIRPTSCAERATSPKKRGKRGSRGNGGRPHSKSSHRSSRKRGKGQQQQRRSLPPVTVVDASAAAEAGPESEASPATSPERQQPPRKRVKRAKKGQEEAGEEKPAKKKKKRRRKLPGHRQLDQHLADIREYVALKAERAAKEKEAADEVERKLEEKRINDAPVEYYPLSTKDLDGLFGKVFGCTCAELKEFGELRSVEADVCLIAAVAMICIQHGNHTPHDLSWGGVRYTWLKVGRLANHIEQFDPDVIAAFKFRAVAPLLRQASRRLTPAMFEEAGHGACSILAWLVRVFHQHPDRLEAVGRDVVSRMVKVLQRLPGGFPEEVLETPLQKTEVQRRAKPTKAEVREAAVVKIQSQARRKAASKRVQQVRREKAVTKIQSQARRKTAAKRVEGVRQQKAAVKLQSLQRQRKAKVRVAEKREEKRRQDMAAVQMQKITRSRLARNEMRKKRAEFQRSASGRMMTVRAKKLLFKRGIKFNDGKRRVVLCYKIGTKHGYELTAYDEAQSGLKLCLPNEMFAAPNGNVDAEIAALKEAVRHLGVLQEDADGQLSILSADFKEGPSHRLVLVLQLTPQFKTARKVGEELLTVKIVRAYGGTFGSSGFILTAAVVRSGEMLHTFVPEEHADVAVLAPVTGDVFRSAMLKMCNSLAVQEADGQLLTQTPSPTPSQGDAEAAAESSKSPEPMVDAAGGGKEEDGSGKAEEPAAGKGKEEEDVELEVVAVEEPQSEEGGKAGEGQAADEAADSTVPMAVLKAVPSGRQLLLLGGMKRQPSKRTLLPLSSTRPPAADEDEQLGEVGRQLAEDKRKRYAAAVKIQSAQRRKAATRRVSGIRKTKRRRAPSSPDEKSRASRDAEAQRLRVGSPDADPFARQSGAGRANAAKRRSVYDENLRSQQEQAAVKLQSQARRKAASKRVSRIKRERAAARARSGTGGGSAYTEQDRAALKLQSQARRRAASKRVQGIKQDKAAVKLQSQARRRAAAKRVQALKEGKQA